MSTDIEGCIEGVSGSSAACEGQNGMHRADSRCSSRCCRLRSGDRVWRWLERGENGRETGKIAEKSRECPLSDELDAVNAMFPNMSRGVTMGPSAKNRIRVGIERVPFKEIKSFPLNQFILSSNEIL